MRYIKFRALRNQGHKKIELVRVTENGKITPKGYGPLLLDVLDGNVRDQGTCIIPPKILCFGATDTIEGISITGAVDVYIDGYDEPILTNVTEEELVAATAEDFKGHLTPYAPPVPSDFDILVATALLPAADVVSTTTLTFGIKRNTDEGERYYSTAVRVYDSENQYDYPYANHSTISELANTLTQWFNDVVGVNVVVSLERTDFIPSSQIYDEFVHGDYMKKFYEPLINSTFDKPVRDFNGQFIRFKAVKFKFTLPPEVEHIVLPSMAVPYGAVGSTSGGYGMFHGNNTMKHNNIVYYADGRVEYDVTTLLEYLPASSVYNHRNVPAFDTGPFVHGQGKTISLDRLDISNDPLSMTQGLYFDVILPDSWIQRVVATYQTEYTDPAECQGIYWLEKSMGGTQNLSDFVALILDDSLFNPITIYPTQDSTTRRLEMWYIDSGAKLRFKVPKDVQSVDITFFTYM